MGTLYAGAQTLRLQLHLQAGVPGAQGCALDSIDQKAFGIPCDNVQQKGDSVSFDVPAVSGKWAGRLSADGATLSGTSTQGLPLPLVFARQQTALQPRQPAAPALQPALPPVDAAGLKAVLDVDLADAIKSGALAMLSNHTTSPETFTDKLGEHIAQRLARVPAVSLAP